MIITRRIGQEWRSCSNLTWWSLEEAGVHATPVGPAGGGTGPKLFSIPSPLLAHIYALGVSAVSRWILMCFKEASPVLSSPPSIHPCVPVPPSLSLSSLPPPCCSSAGSRCAQTRSAFRLAKTPMAPNQRDCANQTTSPVFKLP